MSKANIHHRQSLEAAYPPEAFAGDAAQNGRSDSQRISGVRILSAPDAAGDFELERAAQQVGEATSPAFLAPHRRDDRLAAAATEPDPRQGYDSFLDDLAAAAQRHGFDPDTSPGRADPRLRGLRQ